MPNSGQNPERSVATVDHSSNAAERKNAITISLYSAISLALQNFVH